jgi:EAL domain-containing protein (putative c-di-GMP-specific phosphodiesterase class I)
VKVLAIDDEPDVLRIMQRAFTRAGHEVLGVPDPHAALDAARRGFFDLAVVDYDMPHMNGLEFLERLKTIQPGCPGILASGRLDRSVLIAAVNRGEISRVLEKPFNGAELIAAAQEVVDNRKRLSQLPVKDESSRLERVHLDDVLSGGHLRLAVQPIVDARTRRPAAYEALMRSTHPVLRGPLEVLQAAENHGQVRAVAAEVARCAEAWVRQLPAPERLFVNLHPDELGHPESLRERVEPLRPWASQVVLEITERSRLLDHEAWRGSTEYLRSAGFSLAVDDLGAGYSSLSVLAEVKPQFIKVDMSIVRDVDRDAHKQNLVRLLCDFARATDSLLIAEGVETETEAQALVGCGAHLLQGYHIGRPGFALLP